VRRVIAFANGALGADAIAAIRGHLVGVVLHAPARRRDGERLLAAIPAGVPIIEAPSLAVPATIERLRALQPTHGLSALFGHLLRKQVLDLFPDGIANIHPSLLPAGRGAHPNAWAIATGEPAGATLHLIDSGVDTGPILAQRPVAVDPADTALDLYERLLAACRELLAREVPRWLAGELRPVAQGPGSPARRAKDLDGTLAIDAERSYRARELVDLLRARTFPPYPGAPYRCDGRTYRLRIEIEEDEP
jgi:methionyl-tRNA formyltransferase